MSDFMSLSRLYSLLSTSTGPIHSILMVNKRASTGAGRKFPLSIILAGGLALLLSSAQASAACKGMNCACEPSQLQFASPVLAAGANGKFPIALEADEVESQGDDLVLLSGNAEVSQGRQTIVADELKYYRQSERVVASGNVEMISETGNYLASDSVDVHAPTQIGQLQNTQFKLAKSLSSEGGIDTVAIASRGQADVVNLEGEGLITLENAKYTNCKEGNDDVMVSAKHLELDQTAGVGRARNATIRFKGVPILYAPYISFPINDERKTGLLTPGFGSDEESGNIIELPWYWNISENQDATITPRYFTDRGLQVGAEYRHKSLKSDTFVYGEYLDDDLTGEDRNLITIQHTQYFTDNLIGAINYNDVSDVDYFVDLRNDVRYFSATYVPRDVALSYSGEYIRFGARANEYQIIDPAISENFKPYERLPTIVFDTLLPEGPLDMRYGLSGSYTKFAHDSRLEGTRSSLTSYAYLPFESIWGYVTPKVSLHHRSYSLDNVSAGAEESPSFSVPVFSVDAGIYLEKNSSWFGEKALQTLEPRIFYAYAPNEDQSDVPLFDTSQVRLNNFGNIFRENRFFGQDRVGDTNQVTLGLTTRFIDSESGDERLKASIGQLYLIDDLEQNINSTLPIESGLGDLLFEMRTVAKGPWSTYSFLQYNHDLGEISTARFDFGYQPKDNDRKRISIGYYFSKGLNNSNRDLDQLTLNANWPISDRWQFTASERYSVEDSESLATTVGFEYNSCCWKLRITGQEHINTRSTTFFNSQFANQSIGEKKTSIFIELELTGFGSFRSGI